MIVGSMVDMNDNAITFGKTANEIILEHIKDSMDKTTQET